MTPSEIADWVRTCVEQLRDDEIYVSAMKAAATIRELEASNKARADIIYAQTKASEIDRDKLKIATEALEEICDGATTLAAWRIASQALVRIKSL